MEIVRDTELLLKYLKKNKISEMFDTQGLHFQLLKYSKGEQIVSPLQPLEKILFMVDGTAHLYGLREDCSYSPVAMCTPLTIYGDLEFATGHGNTLFVEAQSQVYCVSLSLVDYGKQLRRDVRFLNMVLKMMGEKFSYVAAMDTFRAGLEDQLLFYLDNYCPDGCIHSIKDTVMQLHCSRRQLQRVLSELCEKGQLEHVKKGTYRRIKG